MDDKLMTIVNKNVYACIHAQVVVGDQLTCKNIRGAKLWRCPELNVIDQLKWANEVPGIYL